MPLRALRAHSPVDFLFMILFSFHPSISFLFFSCSMRYDAIRWMPHSNSSLFVYPSQKLNYMKVLQDVYTAPAGMTIVLCRHLLSTIGMAMKMKKILWCFSVSCSDISNPLLKLFLPSQKESYAIFIFNS